MYLLAAPVLAAGHRTPPCGVGDAESDWIVAVLLGVAGVAGIAVLADRLPTLAGLWRLPALTGVVWFAGVLTVLFGVRQVVRMWAVWVFALAVTTPLPFRPSRSLPGSAPPRSDSGRQGFRGAAGGSPP